MSHSYFELIDEAVDSSGASARFAATEHTVGPWSAQLQHGGPPSALAVTMAERAVGHVTDRPDLAARRVAVDFVGAVPVAEVAAEARLIRAARSAALCEVSLTSGERLCLVARVWFVRETDTVDLASPATGSTPVPDPAGDSDGLGLSFGYGDSIDWRYVQGALATPGPAVVWARPTLPLVAGWDYSSLGRTAVVADSASGVSAELDWAGWSFVNVDLDIHLARPVSGEWILLDAATQLGTAGSALARSTISDEIGVVGAGLQTLVVSQLPTA